MEDDPFYDPDDLEHNLFATGYELDPTGLGGSEPDTERGREDREAGLHLVDEDTLGRGVGLPVPDRDDLEARRAAELAAARRALGRPADRREPAEGVRRVLGEEPDIERAAGTHPSRRAPDSAGADAGDRRNELRPELDADADELRRVTKYLTQQPKARKVRTTTKKRFSEVTFGIDQVRLVVLPSGDVQLSAKVPYEDRWEAMKLMDSAGYVLEASIRMPKRPGK